MENNQKTTTTDTSLDNESLENNQKTTTTDTSLDNETFLAIQAKLSGKIQEEVDDIVSAIESIHYSQGRLEIQLAEKSARLKAKQDKLNRIKGFKSLESLLKSGKKKSEEVVNNDSAPQV